jgi:hypothetical protein
MKSLPSAFVECYRQYLMLRRVARNPALEITPYYDKRYGKSPLCKRGHARIPENLYGREGGPRSCKLCQKVRYQQQRQRAISTREKETEHGR